MKNKRKSILTIFIILSAILGLSYYTNAAENLKAAQDKYRASYNNFMKAMKEGADQDRIDQLSAQCKEDYAEYQKASGQDDSINKNKTNHIKPGKNIAAKQMVKNTNENKALVQNKKIAISPKSIQSKLISAPLKRIDDNGLKSYELPSDKDFLERDSCKNKEKCLEILKKFKNDLDTNPYLNAEYALEDILYNLNGLYPDIYAAAYMCYFQTVFQRLENSYESYENYQSLVSLKSSIEDFINIYTQNTKSKNYYNICGNILDKLPSLVSNVDLKINVFKNQYLGTISSVSSLLKSDKEYFDSIEMLNFHSTTNIPSAANISRMFNDIIGSYDIIIKSCVTIGDYKQAETYMDDLDKFYKGIKGKYELHYNDYPGQAMQTVTVDGIKKNPTIYLDTKNFYLERLLKNDEEIKSDADIKKDATQFVDYLNGIPHFDSEKKQIEMYANSDQKDRLIDRWNTFSTNERTIDRISIGLYDSQKLIAESADVLLVKCSTNLPGHGPLKVEVKSNVSNRMAQLTVLKKMNLNGNSNCYYTTFKYGDHNLIKKHGSGSDELKHSVCISDGLAENLQRNWGNKPNALRTIKESTFYKTFLGEGVVRRKYDEPIERVEINTQFFQSMGFEVLSIANQNSNLPVQSYCYIENQADWFISQSHGVANANGAISLETGLQDCVWNIDSWQPQDLKITCNNIDFVLLGSCSILNISRYKFNSSSGNVEFTVPLNGETNRFFSEKVASSFIKI